MGVLKEVYAKDAGAPLIQRGQEPAGPPPPGGFDTYKKSDAAGGVLSLLQQIISDAKAMEADAIRDEGDAQKAYEDFVKETNASIETKSKDIVSKSEAKSKKEMQVIEDKNS